MLTSLETFHKRKGSQTRKLSLKEKTLRVGTPVVPNRENEFKEEKMAYISYSELRTRGGQCREADKQLLIKTAF